MQTVLLTSLAMLAFAANSLLCRFALEGGHIDAMSFASLRIASGAVLLYALVGRRPRRGDTGEREWLAPAALLAYLLCFSYAYLTLDAGSGALILFGAVQLSMFTVALARGERFAILAWLGSGLALGGLVYLLWPGLSAPPLAGGLLMAVAGVSWGAYSLRGQLTNDALGATARNFIWVVPPTLVVNLLVLRSAHWSAPGIAAAVASGTLASALGYVIWYAALRKLTAMTAATVQLSVPVIATAGGVLLLDERATLRLLLASGAILGGIALVVTRRAPALRGS